jgi:hypothetical protein
MLALWGTGLACDNSDKSRRALIKYKPDKLEAKLNLWLNSKPNDGLLVAWQQCPFYLEWLKSQPRKPARISKILLPDLPSFRRALLDVKYCLLSKLLSKETALPDAVAQNVKDRFAIERTNLCVEATREQALKQNTSPTIVDSLGNFGDSSKSIVAVADDNRQGGRREQFAPRRYRVSLRF